MNWSDEHYVKFYVRDTLTWRTWSWETRVTFALLLRKVDGAGIIETGNLEPAQALALQLELPTHVVAPAVEQLLSDGTVTRLAKSLLIPHFIEAQEARKSEAVKKADQRATVRAARRLEEAIQPLQAQPTDSATSHVPRCPEVSPGVPPSPAQPGPAQPLKGSAGETPPAGPDQVSWDDPLPDGPPPPTPPDRRPPDPLPTPPTPPPAPRRVPAGFDAVPPPHPSRAPAPKAKKRRRKEPHPRRGEVIGALKQAFLERRGVPMTFLDAQVGMTNQLLEMAASVVGAEAAPAEVVRRWCAALDEPRYPRCDTLPQLIREWDSFAQRRRRSTDIDPNDGILRSTPPTQEQLEAWEREGLGRLQ